MKMKICLEFLASRKLNSAFGYGPKFDRQLRDARTAAEQLN